MPITTTPHQHEKGLRIKVSGRFDFNDHQAFRNAYAQVEPQNTAFIIDLSDTDYMDSAALGMLLVLRERAGGMRSDITLGGFNPAIGQILQISRFEDLFKLDSNRAA